MAVIEAGSAGAGRPCVCEHDHFQSHDHSDPLDGSQLFPVMLGVANPGIITPAALTASVNDFDPNGKDTAFVWHLSSTVPVNITGFVAPLADPLLGVPFAMHLVCNVGSQTITLKHNDALSTPANEIYSSRTTDVVLNGPAEACLLVYDPYATVTGRWRALVDTV